jgi:excisionase family DNA binding protein
VVPDTVYRWIKASRMPAHKVGRLWKFKISEVDEWVRAGEASVPKPGRSSGTRRGKDA